MCECVCACVCVSVCVSVHYNKIRNRCNLSVWCLSCQKILADQYTTTLLSLYVRKPVLSTCNI